VAVRKAAIDVSPDRLDRWIEGFAARHGSFEVFPDADGLRLLATDGTTALLTTAFRPDADSAESSLDAFISHARAPRTVGLILVRLGGYAAGVAEAGTLVASKVGSRPVHGRSAAGGWSQHRFARRREGQARTALAAAADAAAAVVTPRVAELDGVVTGGDRQALRGVLADPRLTGLKPLVSPRVLDVPNPKAAVLRDAVLAAAAVRIILSQPEPEPGPEAQPDPFAD
jgi:hypothetical protein